MHKNTRKYMMVGGGVLLLCMFFGVYAINTWATGYRIDSNGHDYVEFNGGYGCRRVDNLGSQAIFVPTKTLAERSSFSGSRTPGISIVPGTGSCGQDPWTCHDGTPINKQGCGGQPAYRDCVDECDISQQTATSCYSLDQC